MKHAMGLAALLALPIGAQAAETVRWTSPWSAMPTLVYETESVTREVKGGAREHTRATDTTEISVLQAREDGFRQRWRSSDLAFEVLEGERALEAPTREAMLAFGAEPLDVELAPEGHYLRLHDAPAVAARFRTAMAPAMRAGIEVALAQQPAAPDVQRMDIERQVAAVLDRLAEPQVLEAMLGRVLQTYNGFVGVDVEPGAWYELATELPNPLGGAPLPAKLQFLLTVSDDDADDVSLEWNSTVDMGKGGDAMWAIVEKLSGQAIPADVRDALPDNVDFRDEGFFLFRRSSGVIEMFESTRTVKLAGTEKIERQRMRLVDGDHAHAWAAEDGAGSGDDDAG